MTSPYSSHWGIDSNITLLNHGSFGPTPVVVQQAREKASRRIASNPHGFMNREIDSELQKSAESLASIFKTEASNIALVTNATYAMNAVANSIQFSPGEEILLNDHEYGAVIRIFREKAAATGAKLVVARLPACLDDPQELVDSLFNSVTGKTRLIVFSHVSSPTSVIFPAQMICDEARKRGILTCIDGPHALAMVNVNLTQLNCDFYVASCHKWLCAPCGTGFLYARKKYQQDLFHPVVSWGRSITGIPDSWKDSFNWHGTYDPSPAMAISEAVNFMFNTIGIETFRTYSYDLARYACQSISDLTGLKNLYSADSNWFGSMVTLPLPDNLPPPPKSPAQKHQLVHQLQEQFQIEIPVMYYKDRPWIRVSTHMYNNRTQIDYLTKALKKLLP